MVALAQPRFSPTELMAIARRIFTDEFDPASNLIGSAPHAVFPALGYAWTLLDAGDPASVGRAEAMLRTILSAQDRREGSPDFGHFRMLFEDPFFADLNAVQLVLIELIPLTREFGAIVSPELRALLRASIRSGLVALATIAAHLTYSNVAVLDIANRILGGEEIADESIIADGIAELDRFIAYTNRSGGIRDYNSPTYLGQMITTLATLGTFASDQLVRRKAGLLQERIWLQAVTHYHPGLAQLAGPYSRAYPGDVLGTPAAMKTIIYAYLDDDRLLGPGSGPERMSPQTAYHLATRTLDVPAYLPQMITGKHYPYDIREGSDRDYGHALTSRLTARHALGTADAGFGSQARSIIAHVAPRTGQQPKIFLSRFLAHGEERDLNTRDPRLTEWGLFAGLQSESRAIALYGAPLEYRRIDALRTELLLLGAEADDTVSTADGPLADGDRLPSGQWLFLDLGQTQVVIYPLSPTPLGGDRERPVSVHRGDGMLRVDIANYAGPLRHFWKYAPLPWESPAGAPGPFFNGNLRAGFLIETIDASDPGETDRFREMMTRSRVTDAVDGTTRRVRWERDDQVLELAVDLVTFRAVDRLINGVPAAVPFLEAPDVIQFDGSDARIGEVRVSATAPGPWLIALDGEYALANPTPATVAVTVGAISVELPAFARASIGRDHEVHIDSATS